MCKMKPSCDEKTAYLFTHSWFTLLELNTLIKSQEGINQSVFATIESQYSYFRVTISICDFILRTCEHTCDVLVIDL